ncbi:MAG TPA: methyltransferase, partial [Actinocrinis sp.]|uniref:methyltransferase n=1 Tax=Actinocrinis sp. TaxID=1920516 RepID=UPI002DDDAC89
MPGRAERRAMFSILTGGWIAQACYAVAKLGVPDALADGPSTVDALAEKVGADRHALHRTLRALAAAGLFREIAAGTFELTATGRLLGSETRGSSRLAAIMFGEEVHEAFGEILHTLRTGRPAFEKIHGEPFYDYLRDRPQAAAMFATAMGSAAVPIVFARCDLGRPRAVVDIGGGDGGLLARMLSRHREARGVLVELPDAIERARARLASSGHADRIEFAAASFFDSGAIPSGADVYTLSRVLHNWNDDAAVQILRRVREAAPPHARLFVFEYLIEDPDEASDATTGADGADGAGSALNAIDLLSLVMLEGYERSAHQYRALLAQAGFEVRAVHAPPLPATRTE